MATQQDTLSITLKFGSWTLPMTILRTDEEMYRQAEALIRDRFSYYSNNYPQQSRELYLLMTTIDIAVRLQRQNAEADTQPLVQRLQPLLDALETAIEKAKERKGK